MCGGFVPPAGLSSGAVDGELHLPRTPTEAATNVSYFAALGYRVVVASPLAAAAADASDVEAVHAPELKDALRR
jgi:hypothetical protein